MALVPCPECQKIVSTEAVACPQCAFPSPGKKIPEKTVATSLLDPSERCGECHYSMSDHAPTCSQRDDSTTTSNGNQLHETTSGQEEAVTSSLGESPETCPDCNFPLSAHAVSCPRCEGSVSTTNGNQLPEKTGGQEEAVTSAIGEPNEVVQQVKKEVTAETWLCPHCRMPYTRKIKDAEDGLVAEGQDTSLPVESPIQQFQEQKIPDVTEKSDMGGTSPVAWMTRPAIQRRSPLWQGTATIVKEEKFPRDPQNRKKPIILGILLLVLVVLSVAFGAIWQLGELNPLEALIYWGM